MSIFKKIFKFVAYSMAFMFFISIVISFVYKDDAMMEDYIAIVSLKGTILDSDKIRKIFDKLEDDKYAKGYILKVDSPGGAVVPSQEIYEYLLTLKKPLYVSMGNVAASGGYMVSLSANRIYAMSSTVTGSIGVIMQTYDFRELMSNIGIKVNTVKSGKFKDIGSESREMTEEDREVLEEVIMDMYDQFVELVSVRRKIPIETVRKIADGRVYTGNKALKLQLVDRIGSWHDAFIDMKKDLNLSDDVPFFEVKPKKKRSIIDEIINEVKSKISANSYIESGFYYMMI